MTLRTLGPTATDFFVSAERGEGSHLKFATIKDAENFALVSSACAAITHNFFASKATQLRSGISSLKRPVTPEDAIIRDHFMEAEHLASKAFLRDASEKKEGLIGKLFFSKLSYSLNWDVPLALSKGETGKITQATCKFIKAAQDVETLNTLIPFIDTFSQKIIDFRDELIDEINYYFITYEPQFPGLWNIFLLHRTGEFQRPTEATVRAHLAAITQQENLDFSEDEITMLMSAPEALTHGLNANNIAILRNSYMQYFPNIEEHDRVNSLLENWERSKQLPYGNFTENALKASSIRKSAVALLDVSRGGNNINFTWGSFTQLLPEMSIVIQELETARLPYNPFRRVPLFPAHIKSISMKGNPLKCFMNLLNLPELKSVNFEGSCLQMVPLELELIAPKLDYINLADNNLIELPETFALDDVLGITKEIDVSGNPLIYVPPQLFSLNLMGISILTDRSMLVDMVYQGKSSLAKFYQYFVRPSNTYNKEEAAKLLASLSTENRNLIFKRVWVESGSPMPSDPVWGEIHALDNIPLLARAVRSAILTKVDRIILPRHCVYDRIKTILPISNSWPDHSFEHNAKKHIAILADALSFEEVASPIHEDLFENSLDYLLSLSQIISDVQRFNRDYLPEERFLNGPSDFFMGKAQDHRNESKSLS